jgi:hypothetical protein
MSSILSHRGNANQNITEISSHPSQNGFQQNNTNVGDDARKKGLL